MKWCFSFDGAVRPWCGYSSGHVSFFVSSWLVLLTGLVVYAVLDNVGFVECYLSRGAQVGMFWYSVQLMTTGWLLSLGCYCFGLLVLVNGAV